MTPLSLLAQHVVHCACSDATRVQLGSWSVPVGPVTVIFAATAMIFAPPAAFGWITGHRRARAMRDVLSAPG